MAIRNGYARNGKAAAALRVAAALPDPPFEFPTEEGPAGFDVALMQRIAAMVGRTWRLIRYTGADFNGVFAGLDDNAMFASPRVRRSRPTANGSQTSARRTRFRAS